MSLTKICRMRAAFNPCLTVRTTYWRKYRLKLESMPIETQLWNSIPPSKPHCQCSCGITSECNPGRQNRSRTGSCILHPMKTILDTPVPAVQKSLNVSGTSRPKTTKQKHARLGAGLMQIRFVGLASIMNLILPSFFVTKNTHIELRAALTKHK